MTGSMRRACAKVLWRLCRLGGLAAVLALPVAHAGVVVHAAPDGAASGECGVQAPCSLTAAQHRVRALRAAGDSVQVELQGGIYRLHEPLRLDARDSGTAGAPVRWEAAPGAYPVLSGSRLLQGARDGALWQFVLPADAAAPTSLYVDGQRRWPARTAACPHCTVDANGLANLPPPTRQQLKPGSLAVLHARWRDFRCRVTAVGADRVDLAQPCWHNAALDSAGNGWAVASPVGKYYGGVDWFENLSGAPTGSGTYTVDAHHVLRYRPTPAEAAHPPVIELPGLTHLLVLGGTPAAPVHDLVFRGITFAGTEWQQAATDDGYVSLQAGYLITGTGRRALPDDGEGMRRSAGAVMVEGGRNIVFDRDGFQQLAAAGITLATGTHGAAVTRSTFADLGGGAIFVGDIAGHPADWRAKSSTVVVADNTIDHVALAYRDQVAVMAGFVDGLDIAHNTIRDLPYTGISVGWGWNFEGDAATESAIHIVANRIERVMRQLADGGAIYTQGQSTPGTSCIVRNAIDIRRDPGANGIYLDEHSTYFDVERNVILGAWVSAWAPWSGHLRIVDNWTDTAGKPHKPGPTKVWAPNATNLATLPAAARAVQRAAGVRANAAPPALPIHVPAACPRAATSHSLQPGATP